MGVSTGMRNQPLTALERGKAWRRIFGFGLLNGFSFAILGENILVLYALKAGVSEPMTAVLGSFLFLTMPFMLIGRQLMRRIGAARTQGIGWLCRNTFGLLMAGAPLAASLGAQALVPILVLVGGFGFYACRSMGAIGFRPLIGEVTRARNRGQFMGRFGLSVNLSYLAALVLFATTMRLRSDLIAFQWLIFVGSVAGLVSAGFLMAVPEGPGPARSASEPLRNTLRQVWQSVRLRRMVLAQMSAWATIGLVLPVSMMAVRRGYEVSEFNAILFVFVQIGGGLVVSLVGTVLSDRIGPRPIVGIGGVGMLCAALLWTVAPASFAAAYPGFIFLVLGLAKGGIDLGLTHYIVSATEEKDRVGIGMLTMVLGGASAGFFGAVVSGGTLRILQNFELLQLQIYRIYFLVASVFVLPLLWIILRLKPLGDWKIRSVLGLLVSPRDLFTLIVLSKLESANTPEAEQAGVSRLQNLGSELGEEALLRYLDSPDFRVRSQALHALSSISLSSRGIEALIRELHENVYTTAYIAAEVLGKQQVADAIPALRQAMESSDVYLKGKAMVALAELRDEPSVARILEAFHDTDNPRLVIHGALAIAEIGDEHLIGDLLAKVGHRRLPPLVRRELHQRIAILDGDGNRYYRLYKLLRDEPNEAFEDLVPDTPAQLHPVLTRLSRGVSADALDELRRQLLALVEERADPQAQAVRKFLTDHPDPRELDAESALLLVLLAVPSPREDR